ncbi:MAG: hypothetical protein HC880_10930 [Bacteroidia bacterium]|nr:hypothetical protein [Bacteroidia bacterium]
MQRIIGKYGNTHSKTLIICLGGIHGNEPSGIFALEQVFHALYQAHPSFQGYLLGISGNHNALLRKKRFIHEDLNRLWTDANIRLVRQHLLHSPELKEMASIFGILDALNLHHFTQKVFVDLHTTSAEDGTFIVATDYDRSRYIIDFLSAPIILGLGEQLEGTAIRYLQHQGFIAFAFEGGQHEAPYAVDNLVKAIWKTLLCAGCISQEDIPKEVAERPMVLKEDAILPKVLNLAYLHKVKPSDNFEMKPGFKNFDPIKMGDILARDREGWVKAPLDGYLLMPLYQKKGDDGFLLSGKKNKSFYWLSRLVTRRAFSSILRRR